MTNEEFEKRMEFIIEHQAQFASHIQQLRESQARTEQGLARTEQALAQTEDLLTRLVRVTFEGFQDVNAKIDALVDSQIQLTDRVDTLGGKVEVLTADVNKLTTDVSTLTAKVNTLADAQTLTDKNLRNFIAVVDRYIQEDRNGVQ